MMSPKKRLRREIREEKIIRAITPVFARYGYRGATTKLLAKAGKISEALLYKYFPSKKKMYERILQECIDSAKPLAREIVSSLDPSTENLVYLVWLLVYSSEHRTFVKDSFMHNALIHFIINSLQDDGKVATTLIEKMHSHWLEKLKACLRQAEQEGVLTDISGHEQFLSLVVHNLLLGMTVMDFPRVKPVQYGLRKEEIIDATATFILKGLGFSAADLKKYYTPREFFRRLEISRKLPHLTE